MLQLKQGGISFFKFDGIAEHTEEAIKASRPYLNKGSWNSCMPGQAYFVGREFTNYQQVLKAVNELWPEGMEVYDRMRRQLSNHHFTPPKSIRRRGTWSEDGGDEICLDRLRRQQPFWRTTHRDDRPGPVNVTIVTDTATFRNVSAQDILWRGAASILLTEMLEEAGYRVELWSAHHVSRAYAVKPGSFAGACLLKGPSNPLDISSLLNAVSGWFHRTIEFADLALVAQPSNGCGAPESLSTVLPLITPDLQTVVCADIWSEHQAITWVEKQLEKFQTGAFTLNS